MNEKQGSCQGLCSGLYSHHLVNGLCPVCRSDERIRDHALMQEAHEHGAPLGDDQMPHGFPNVKTKGLKT